MEDPMDLTSVPEEHDTGEPTPGPAAAAPAAAPAAADPRQPHSVGTKSSGSATRNDVLFDLTKSFRLAFDEWIGLQGSDLILTDERYDLILTVLQQANKQHAKYRYWSDKYTVVSIPSTPSYLVQRVDANKRAAPRGLGANEKKRTPQQDADELRASEAQSVRSDENAAAAAASSSQPVWVMKRVPRASEIESILQTAHMSGPKGTGHGGSLATYKKIAMSWVNISRPLVEAYVKRCAECMLSSPATSSRYEIKAITTEAFWYRLQVDLFTYKEISESDQEQNDTTNIVMHLQCHFSKFCILRCLPDKSGMSVAMALEDVWCEFGPPNILQSDNGSEFKNAFMTALAQQWGYELVNSAPYKPSTQGSVERNNGLAKDKLRCAIAEAKALGLSQATSWQRLISLTQWHLNSTYRRSIKMSSYQVVFNRIPRANVVPPTVNVLQEDVATALPAILQQHRDVHAAAAASSSHYQQQFVEQHNKGGSVKPQLKAGDLVTLKMRNPRHNKGIGPAKLGMMPREFAVILLKDKAGKFVLFTQYGVLTEHLPANEIEPAAETVRPRALAIDHVAMLEQHKQNMSGGSNGITRITMAQLLKLASKPDDIVVNQSTLNLRIKRRKLA